MLKQISLFAGGSTLGASIDYCITLATAGWLGLDPAYALALAMLISASVVFLFHAYITFERSTVDGAKSKFTQAYFLFMGWSVLIYFLRVILLKGILYAGLPLAIALFFAMALAAIVNYAISSALIFAKKPS